MRTLDTKKFRFRARLRTRAAVHVLVVLGSLLLAGLFPCGANLALAQGVSQSGQGNGGAPQSRDPQTDGARRGQKIYPPRGAGHGAFAPEYAGSATGANGQPRSGERVLGESLEAGPVLAFGAPFFASYGVDLLFHRALLLELSGSYGVPLSVANVDVAVSHVQLLGAYFLTRWLFAGVGLGQQWSSLSVAGNYESAGGVNVGFQTTESVSMTYGLVLVGAQFRLASSFFLGANVGVQLPIYHVNNSLLTASNASLLPDLRASSGYAGIESDISALKPYFTARYSPVVELLRLGYLF